MRVKRAQLQGVPSFIGDINKIATRLEESEREFKSVWVSDEDKKSIYKTVDEEVEELIAQETKRNAQQDEDTGPWYPVPTAKGDRLLTDIMLSDVPKDFIKTDLVRGLWTLPIEILYRLETGVVDVGLPHKQPSFSEVASFCLNLFGSDKLSDDQTKVEDIPAHRWWEAFNTLLEHDLIELSAERKIERLKI